MKKKVKRKFNFLKFLVVLLIIYILYFSISLLLNIKTKNIVIINNNYYSDEKIIETSNIENYPKFILLSKSKIKKKLRALDLIEDVSIKKDYLKFKITISVKEKKPLYITRSDNQLTVSTKEKYDINITGIPTLINYVPEKIESEFIEEFTKVDNNIISKISEIEYSKTSYDDERFLLYMNDGNNVYVTNNKLTNLNKYTSIIKKIGDKKGILYLDSGNYFEVKEK